MTEDKQEELENIQALAAMASVFGNEFKDLDIKYTDKPSTGSGVEFNLKDLIQREAQSKNGISITKPNIKIQTPINNLPAAPMSTVKENSTIHNESLIQELQGVKQILLKIDNNLSKISGMAGKIFSNINK